MATTAAGSTRAPPTHHERRCSCLHAHHGTAVITAWRVPASRRTPACLRQTSSGA
jgi:hypothetical protein